MDFHTKPTTFISKGIEFLICKTDLETDLVTIKNMSNGKRADIDYYKLQKIMNET